MLLINLFFSCKVSCATDTTKAGDCPESPQEQLTSRLTTEQKERIERNRAIARERLKKRLESESVVLTEAEQYSSNAKRNDFGGFVFGDGVPKKRAKMGKESEFITELRNVCSDGSVVKIQGTKLIDTGGGFLIEESDFIEQEEEETVLSVRPAALVPTDTPNCAECGLPFVDSFLFLKFNYPVCDGCKDIEDKHKLITKTDARTEYLLKDADLDKREPVLQFISRPNPHNNRWGDMKLYLRLQVEQRAIAVWGSLKNIEEQIELREENRAKTKIKKYNKKMGSLRMAARSSLYTRDLAPHVHTWGPDVRVDEDDDQYKHTCTACGQEETFEKM